jgi:hypothetical protein
MVPHLRQSFNASFTPEKYSDFLAGLERRCGTPVLFRNSETPCFYPKPLLDKMAAYGEELIHQLVDDPAYISASRDAIPAEFRVPGETSRPEFVQVDFGLVRNPAGEIEPKLIEIQGFPSLYGYQIALAHEYLQAYGLDARLKYLLGGLTPDSYERLLRQLVVGREDPENVVLMEIDPLEQKTLPDFLVTERACGIKTVNVREVIKRGKQLFYHARGREIPIRRIYNRVIVDELIRKRIELPFRFSDPLDVEWAGHPNWFFQISKFSLPYLRHPCVPRTWFLDRMDRLPDSLDRYVLKPLFSFAGSGVIVGPTAADVAAIPANARGQYILQERLEFAPVFETPAGATKAEARIMFLWGDTLQPGAILVRMGRGLLMGVSYNREPWAGSSAGFYLDE